MDTIICSRDKEQTTNRTEYVVFIESDIDRKINYSQSTNNQYDRFLIYTEAIYIQNDEKLPMNKQKHI